MVTSTEYRKKNRPTVEQIHRSLENGQKLQMVDQIKQYGVKDFFVDYKVWLNELSFDSGWDAFSWYSTATVLYFENRRVKNRHG